MNHLSSNMNFKPLATMPKNTPNILYHGTSAETADRIRANGGFTDDTAKMSKNLAGFEVDPVTPISLTREFATAQKYVNPRPDGKPGVLLMFSAENLNIASEADIARIGLNGLKSSDPDAFRTKLKMLGYDGYDSSSPHDEAVETIVFNKEKLKLLSLP
jgi:hypothetical protein